VQTIAGKTVISPSPKNDSSRRVLPVPPRALARLRAHWENHQEERALGGPEWKEHGLIFASGIGTPVLPANLHRALHGEKARDGRAQTKGFMEKAGVPERRIHDLRHTCATLLGEQGEREEVIAALLGHTPATITRHYANVRLDTLRAAVERLERVLLDESEAARDAQ
jgi:integrase